MVTLKIKVIGTIQKLILQDQRKCGAEEMHKIDLWKPLIFLHLFFFQNQDPRGNVGLKKLTVTQSVHVIIRFSSEENQLNN